MSDWQVGDLALCVDTASREPWTRDVKAIRKGHFYTVEAVWIDCEGDTLLGLRNIRADTRYGGYIERRFRKIPPHTRDAEDDETIRLLTGAPVLEPTALTAWRERWNKIEEEL